MTTMLFAVALAALASPPPAPQIATELVAGRGYGMPGAIGGTPDGEFIFSCEGAAIAIIQPGRLPQGIRDPDVEFDHPIKRFELGHFRPHVVRMIMDPESDLGDGSTLLHEGSDYRNYLYIAAGPNGLWVVDMDTDVASPNRVARIDDSASCDGVQDSDRHCNDVTLVDVGEDTYVVASFASRDDNRLRFYRLEDVRGVLGEASSLTAETGRETVPVLEATVGAYGSGDPALTYERGPYQIGGSFASDLIADEGDPCEDFNHLYVAMRTDGLVRVEVREDDLASGTLPASRIQWGPRFGDGSHYATVAPPAPFDDERELYTNFNWVNQAFDPDVTERSDPPYFTALALHTDDMDGQAQRHGHKLYVSVDGLGIVVFDVSDPAAWGPTMPIDHHEGEPIDFQGGPGLSNPGAWPERIAALSPASSSSLVTNIIGWIRDIAIVDTGDGLHLVATSTGEASIANAPMYLEGFAYEDQFQYGGVTHFEPARGRRLGETRVWRVGDFPDASEAVMLTPNQTLSAGGNSLFVPPEQSNQMGVPPGPHRLEFVHNFASSNEPDVPGTQYVIPTICMVSVPLTATTPGGTVVAIRDRDFIAGRRTFGMQQSLVDADLIMTSDNDGFSREGLPYLTGNPGNYDVDVDYDPTAAGGNDRRLSTGVIMGRGSQFLDPRLGPNQQAQFGAGAATHRIQIQTIPSSFLGTPAVDEFRVNLLQAPSRWNQTGRAFYLAGMMDARYDAWVQGNIPGLSSAEYYFLFRQTNPDGVVYGRRDALMDLVTAGGLANDQFLTTGAQNAAGMQLRTLNTHPEFDEFPYSPTDPNFEAAARWFGQVVFPHPYSLRVKTWEPELVQVRPKAGSSHSQGWVLAVPCGVSALGESEAPDIADTLRVPQFPYTPLDQIAVSTGGGEVAVGSSDWLPDAESATAEAFEHGLVQLWDFTDPSNVPEVAGKPAGSSNLGKIYLPIASEDTPNPDDVGRSSFAWHLECFEAEIEGQLHSYVITGDFIGGVHAHEVSDVLNGTAPTLQDSWYPPLGHQDLLTNNIRDVVLDRTANEVYAYVAVQRIGIVVLRMDLSPTGALTMTEVERIDDIKEPLTLHLRVVESTGERLLYACDHRQALRVYSSL